jgi:hypothetical protein
MRCIFAYCHTALLFSINRRRQYQFRVAVHSEPERMSINFLMEAFYRRDLESQAQYGMHALPDHANRRQEMRCMAAKD